MARSVEFFQIFCFKNPHNKINLFTYFQLIWVETPTNPTLKIGDIAAISKLAKARGDIIVVVDNTFLTPYLQKPLDFGADIVVYSLTKYMNGHSDVIMGSAVVNDDALENSLRFLQNGNIFYVK